MTIRAIVQQPHPGARIDLFKLDLTPIGGAVFYLTNTVRERPGGTTTPILFGGIGYQPLAIEAAGFERTSTGGFPRPRLRMGSQTYAIIAAALRLGDLIGAIVTRTRTFDAYLDDGGSPDSTQKLPDDVFIISRRSRLDRQTIEWEMKAAVDMENITLPLRKVVRDYCQWSYRYWSGASLQFVNFPECPYRGGACYRLDNTVTTNPAEDQCNKTLTACRLRFPGSQPLPFGGFPGAR